MLDELQDRRVVEDRRVDDAPTGKRRDDDHRDPEAIAEPIDDRGDDVVVEPSGLVPRQEDDRGVPLRARLEGAQDVERPRLADRDALGGVFAVRRLLGIHKGHGRQVSR